VSPIEARKTLEAYWRERLKVAAVCYRNAKEVAAKAHSAWRDGELARPDGYHALQKAAADEAQALREYTRVLRIFSDLVVHKKVTLPE